jgi:pimeloyl-ACP methyl ester carboxylesterase
LNKNVYGTNYYASWADGDDVNKLIRHIPRSRQINIVGHSWGGDTAVNVVIDNPSRINTLITIDPVTRFERPDFNKVSNSVRNWINVYATGRPDNPIGSGLFNGNLIARGAGRWNNDTQGYADITIPAAINHNEFSAGMNVILPNNRTSVQWLNVQ